MKKSLSRELGKLCALCHEISTTTEHDVFFEYSPHVRGICVRVYEGGWCGGKDFVYLIEENSRIMFKNINRVKSLLLEYKKAPTGAATPDVGAKEINHLQGTPDFGDCQEEGLNEHGRKNKRQAVLS